MKACVAWFRPRLRNGSAPLAFWSRQLASDLLLFAPKNVVVFNPLEDQWLNVPVGHWIIRGVKGELYPCEPEVFAATYEPA